MKELLENDHWSFSYNSFVKFHCKNYESHKMNVDMLYSNLLKLGVPGLVVKPVTCLAADMCLTADPGVASSIPARSHTFLEIDHEIISTVILLSSADSRRVVVSYKRNYVHKVLVNRLVKLSQKKVWLGELNRPDITIAVDLM